MAEPFCSPQVGIDAATVPGDTVIVAGQYDTPITIDNTGSATAPITIEAFDGRKFTVGAPLASTTAPITITGASYVNVEGFTVPQSSARMVYVTGSNHVTIDNFIGGIEGAAGQTPGTTALPGVEIAGDSSDVTVSRGQFLDPARTAPVIQLDPGSSGDVITTNGVEDHTTAIVADGAPGTDVVSNTIVGAGDGLCAKAAPAISLTGASSGSYIENNVLEPDVACSDSSTTAGQISVAADSTTGTTEAYNMLSGDDFVSGTDNPVEYAYAWGGTFYSTVASLTAATGQGGHDIIGDPQVSGVWTFQPWTASPAINSANSAAPGELSTDILGDTRVNDPLIADTGAGTYGYYDRGAAQLQPSASTTTVTAQPAGALGATVSWGHWSSTGYTVDFGDGTAAIPATYGTATHTYAKPGTYTITISGTDVASGSPFADKTSFTTTALGAGILYDDEVPANGTWTVTGAYSPTGWTGITDAAVTALPDGSSQFLAVTSAGELEHNIYTAKGAYQGWNTIAQPDVTITDASIAGMPNGSSQIIEVTSTGVLKHDIRNANGSWQASGWGSPAGSTNIAQASITAMPDGDSQLLAVTTNGTLEHNIRHANGTWQGWNTIAQPGVTVTDASIAGMPNGSSQIIEVTSTGVLKHDIRNANGSWQASGWGSPAGSTNIAQASITAMPDGESQLLAVSTSGALEHDARLANGAWQADGWATANQSDLVASVSDAYIAGLPNGDTQVIELSAN